jgi:hypothetical protein
MLEPPQEIDLGKVWLPISLYAYSTDNYEISKLDTGTETNRDPRSIEITPAYHEARPISNTGEMVYLIG